MLTTIFVLLIVYQIKHFLADYPLQGAYMLKKFMGGWDWVLPLAAHAGVHGLFTLGIVLCVNPALWWLALVDMGIHFAMDRIKASPNLLGRYKNVTAKEYVAIKSALAGHSRVAEYYGKTDAELNGLLKGNTFFWWALGLDQMVHHLTHYFVIWMLIS